jgi:hypothetical protein
MNVCELSPAFASLLSLLLWVPSYCDDGSIIYASAEENFLHPDCLGYTVVTS